MRYVGIDPGLRGAIAVLDSAGQILVVYDMPSAPVRVNGKRRHELDMAALADILGEWPLDVTAVVERVHSMPAQGVASSFSFGLVYGAIRQALACGQVPTRLVTPQVWKKYFSLGSGKDEARAKAAALFPAQAALFARKKDDGRAESSLIALYGLRGFQ